MTKKVVTSAFSEIFNFYIGSYNDFHLRPLTAKFSKQVHQKELT